MSTTTLPVDADLHGLATLVRGWTVEISGRDGDGRGSGVVWHPSGLIVTNAHVAGDARRHRVRLGDGREAEARLLFQDDGRDIALLQTDLVGVPDLPLGNPAVLRPGSIVLAHGHPWGVAHALSLGVVHAIARDRRGAPRHIAADVRLAPGNSGGPLVDATGRIVGINAMIVGGLGVAIPVNVVSRVIREAVAAGALPSQVSWAA
ncbi:MAG: S1C family serine protease [Gemmatimonadaceae bacterium]